MAGTNTITDKIDQGSIRKITFDWLSDASGDVSGTNTAHVSGQILRVVFKPDGGGTQPTNLYDVVLNDSNGMDVLAALGANLANNANTQVVPCMTDGNAGNMAPMAVNDVLSLVVSNAGDSKGGTVIIYVR